MYFNFFFRTTMGENVLEYNGVLFDEDDPYSDRDDDCSLSEDDFLELPFNDRTVCKHWLKVMKYTLLDITRYSCNLGHLNVSSNFQMFVAKNQSIWMCYVILLRHTNFRCGKYLPINYVTFGNDLNTSSTMLE